MFSVSDFTENTEFFFLWIKKYHNHPFSMFIKIVFPTYSFSKSIREVIYEKN
jgi:hypothetical protein